MRAGTSRKSIGKSGGEKPRRIRSRRLSTGERGPHTSTVTSGSQSGAKKRRPSRWSRCRCVRKRWTWRTPRRTRSSPSARMPVPASRTSAVSPSRSTSTQEVLPPYVTVSGPGVGNEPRQPQTLSWRDNLLVAPEDDDDADELVRVRKQRERRHLDLALDAVDARDVAKVGRAPLVQRDAPRALVGRD